MSVDCLVSPSQLRGLSYETAKLYGMPHVGCTYEREDISATAWDSEDYRTCAFCGRTDGPHSRHHEPPRSKGSFRLDTPWGQFVLLPALIDLCGSGTTGCHGMRHDGKLKVAWLWDSDEEERKWWNGEWLRQGLKPHGEWLYGHGRYLIASKDDVREIRGGLTPYGRYTLAQLRARAERTSRLKEEAAERIGFTGGEDE